MAIDLTKTRAPERVLMSESFNRKRVRLSKVDLRKHTDTSCDNVVCDKRKKERS